uniref:Uncharacterized protein n=1 Tax=Tanacetum cinerariifolium TaxID=118510 RepID=A0A6L2P5N5_TANCI|nr:hypothetical protein [Tanacetum cinerariifolium]
MCFNSSTGLYSSQLDKQWFNLHKDILRDALDITPTNDNNHFGAPPSSDTVIEYVNTLGYPCTLRNMSAMSVNVLYQPWRAILSMINMCLTEFVHSIKTFLTDKKNLTTASRGKKKSSHLLIPSVRFTKLIIYHLKTKHNIHPINGLSLHYSHVENVLNTLKFVRNDGREIFGMPIPYALLTNAIKRAPYYSGYLEHIAEYQRYMDEEHDKEKEKQVVIESPNATKVTKPKAAKQTKPSAPKAPKVTKHADPKPTSFQPPKPTLAPTEPSKKDQGNKHKLVKEASYTPSYAKRSKAGKVTKKRMPKSPLQLVDEFVDEDVPGKEHAYDNEEANLQWALELNTPKNKSHVDQFIFQRRTLMPTEPFGHAESPAWMRKCLRSILEIKMKARLDQPCHVVHVGPNLEHADLEATDASTQQNLEQMDEEFTTTAYLNVQENLKLPTEDQDTSSVPPMTTPVINVTVSQPVSTTVQASLLTSTTIATTITTTTTLPPPPPYIQQSTTDSILLQCINKSYEAHEDHKNLFDALQKSLEHDYSNQLLLDLEQHARRKERDMTYQELLLGLHLHNHHIYLLQQARLRLQTLGMITCPKLTREKTGGNHYLKRKDQGLLNLLGSFHLPMYLVYLRYGNKGIRPALSISKMKAARYPDFGLELLVLEQLHDSSSRQKEVRTHMRILSVVSIIVYSRYGYDYLSEIVLQRYDFQEYTIAGKNFKNLYPSDFEDLNLLLLQGHLDHLPVVFLVDNNERKIMRLNEIYKFIDDTLTRILKALDYKVKEFKVKRLNSGMNTRFWTQRDVTRSKEFIVAIERRLKTRRIYQNLECFVGGRVHDIDYRLLQRTKGYRHSI